MDESEFWVKVWKIVAATFVALVVTFAGCTSHQVSTIERMTAAGANPLDAKCAVFLSCLCGSERVSHAYKSVNTVSELPVRQ